MLDAAKLKELGLDKTKKFVEVTARGRKRRFAIVSAPPGGDSPYIQDTQDKKVYIVPRAVLSDLQAASTNLPERRLHAFRIEDVDKLTLTSGGKTREFTGPRIEDFPGIRLAPVATPDKHDATLKNWHDRVFNLFPTEVLGTGRGPGGGRAEPGHPAGVLLARPPHRLDRARPQPGSAGAGGVHHQHHPAHPAPGPGLGAQRVHPGLVQAGRRRPGAAQRGRDVGRQKITRQAVSDPGRSG